MPKQEKTPLVPPNLTRPYEPPARQARAAVFPGESVAARHITVTVANDEQIEVPIELLPHIGALRLIYDEADPRGEDPFIFEHVRGSTLERIKLYYAHYKHNPGRLETPSDERFHENENRYNLDSYELQMVAELPNAQLVEDIESANLLDCSDYRWVLQTELAKRIERQTDVEQLRRMLRVDDDFTPEDRHIVWQNEETWIYCIDKRINKKKGEIEKIPNVVGFRPVDLTHVEETNPGAVAAATATAASSSEASDDDDVMNWE